MRETASLMLKTLQFNLGVAILVGRLILQASGFSEQGSQDCRDGTLPIASSNATPAPPSSVPSVSKPHSVRLSWSSSIPANSSPGNTILGYNVYRRDPGKEYEKISTDLIRGTSCIDYLVKEGQTYYYETKAVSASGAESKASSEVKAVIPLQ